LSGSGLSISVLTACTGLKISASGDVLTLADFRRGPDHVAARHRQLAASLVPAERLYRGQQHLRLMRGVDAARQSGHEVSVSIVSAGYGLLEGDATVVPYECTFQDMRAPDRRAWADRLGLQTAVKRFLERDADIAIVLLGDDYFDACGLPGDVDLGAPTLVVCGTRTGLRLAPVPSVHPLVLHKSDTRRFRCGLVGLKGEVAGRLLARLADHRFLVERLESAQLVEELATSPIASGMRALA
jgi:hypothetical protein